MKESYKTGYKYAELGKSVKENPYSGKEEKEEFVKGFYQWLIKKQHAQNS